MGYAKRKGDVIRAEARKVATMLEGLKVVLDVQHLYRTGIHAGDRGTIFHMEGGAHVAEADLALHYAQVAMVALRGWGATVLTNEPAQGILVGPYSRRQAAAMVLGANCYVACHVNAGDGGYCLGEFMDGTPGVGLAGWITAALVEGCHELKSAQVAPLKPGKRGAVCIKGFTAGPAVICEPFFGDRFGHWPLMTAAGLERVGAALARGISDWWTKRLTGVPR